MGETYTIGIADRNRNVREYLKRELMLDGHRIFLLKSGREVVEFMESVQPVDLLILDPDLPDSSEMDILDFLDKLNPVVPVVVHTYLSYYADHSRILRSLAFVEKNGNSIDRLKKVVSEYLFPSYPNRNKFSSASKVPQRLRKIDFRKYDQRKKG